MGNKGAEAGGMTSLKAESVMLADIRQLVPVTELYRVLIETVAALIPAGAILYFLAFGGASRQFHDPDFHVFATAVALLLSHSVLRAYRLTQAFSTIYSQEELLRQLKDANAELFRAASTDFLTGVANRRHFLEQLGTELSRRGRRAEALSLIALDLDTSKRSMTPMGISRAIRS